MKCVRHGITDSKAYLDKALEDLEGEIEHVSISIEGKRPKFAPKIEDLRKSIANALRIMEDKVGITCTTGEGLTAFGRGEGIFVTAILTVN